MNRFGRVAGAALAFASAFAGQNAVAQNTAAQAAPRTAAPPASLGVAGEWRLEFRFESNSADAAAKPAPWLTFTATVVQVDSGIGGAMRSDGPTGQFGCKRLADDSCSAGRMRLSWDEQDWQVFEFRLDPGSRDKGAGRAEIRFPNGATDKYSFVMSRLGKS